MSSLVKIATSAGGSIVMEVEDGAATGPMTKAAARPGAKLTEAKVALEEALEEFKTPLKGMLEKLRQLAQPLPQQIEVEFGFTFSAEVGLVVAKGTTGANFKVKLTWKNDSKP
ncbi:MAG: CU044_2847 family protein [Desulfomonilaceae bacterium]